MFIPTLCQIVRQTVKLYSQVLHSTIITTFLMTLYNQAFVANLSGAFEFLGLCSFLVLAGTDLVFR